MLRDVLIEDVTFNTGDDCIAIKSGRNADGRRVNTPSENIVVRNCRMMGGHGGVSLGSEASGGIRNIFVHDCHMGSPNLNRALRLKSNSYRGGYIENIVFRDVTIDSVADDIFQVDLSYGEGRAGRSIRVSMVCGLRGSPAARPTVPSTSRVMPTISSPASRCAIAALITWPILHRLPMPRCGPPQRDHQRQGWQP
ncbi:MAG: glycosyl hydrolase family 28 protein [Asticcacaulis sp.]